MTRKDYMEGRVSFAEYYRMIYQEAGISYVTDKAMVKRVKTALANGDEHLNTIPLSFWDSLLPIVCERSLARAFSAHGDGYSIAGAICAHKQAARDAATL